MVKQRTIVSAVTVTGVVETSLVVTLNPVTMSSKVLLSEATRMPPPAVCSSP